MARAVWPYISCCTERLLTLASHQFIFGAFMSCLAVRETDASRDRDTPAPAAPEPRLP